MTSFAIANPHATATTSVAEVSAAAYGAYVRALRTSSHEAAVKTCLGVIEEMLGVSDGPVVDKYKKRCTVALQFRRTQGLKY